MLPSDYFNSRRGSNDPTQLRQRDIIATPLAFPVVSGDLRNRESFIKIYRSGLNEQPVLQKGFSDFGSFTFWGLLGLGSAAVFLDLYTRYKNAKTLEEQQKIKSDAYNQYNSGKITLEQYQKLLGVSPVTWMDEYGMYVYGGIIGLLIVLILVLVLKKGRK